ncbi:MAG: hypothetical protein GTO45_04725 [Candidatus Aminicenantes bacterium]|nr:hypothetical protein [Candidatus Aminicenantes bacterium]NIM78057.1 hypothetical protein [Candidatus Aminicenantes bacterium]NIN17374.1 hypothetical protein [Candidatus Aminicenantes bacterium]NIN41267.1 hypothetical protein [Candidatus Aminicenantes bacterium]NIN84040.1 hypothetical protein [Candidatus Aminicenantes bacterium]
MLVEKKRLIELLAHEDNRVVRAASEALEKFFYGSGDVIEHLLKALDINKSDLDESLLAARIKYFIPTDNDLLEILRLIIELEDKADVASSNISWHLMNSLLEFPFQLLEKNYSSFSSNKGLLSIFEIAKNQAEVKNLEPAVLWEKLEKICRQYRDKEMERDDDEYCELLVKALSQKGEKIKQKVMMYLSQEDMNDYHLEFYLVKLAGKLRIKETIPHLFRILINSDPLEFVYSQSIEALGKIGTPEVVEEIDSLYLSHKELRNSFAEILKYIPHDYSEKLALKLLGKENDTEAKTFLAGALCDIFSINSGELIIDIIRKKQYEPSIMELPDYLIPVYAYHNKTIDNLAELEREDKEFRDEHYHTHHPIFKIAKQVKPSEDDDAIEDEESEPFDIDMEDNQRGTKKLPMSRIPSKKRYKKKKKKG